MNKENKMFVLYTVIIVFLYTMFMANSIVNANRYNALEQTNADLTQALDECSKK